MSDLKETLQQLNTEFVKTTTSEDSSNYLELSQTFQALEAGLREYIEAITVKSMRQIISKLKSGTSLTEDEINCVRVWIVGDAEYYVKVENDYGNWLNELKRLVGEINKMGVHQEDLVGAAELRATLRDALRVIGDIVFYLDQKERIKNFQESIPQIDSEERELLIRLLQRKVDLPTE